MKKYLLSIFAVLLAVGFSAFTKAPASRKAASTSYYWYAVDYSVPGGRVISNSGFLFGGPQTQPDAQANDGCDDVEEIHCLRGFAQQLPPNQIVTTFDESTPMPEQ
jgi:hypothetical protein